MDLMRLKSRFWQDWTSAGSSRGEKVAFFHLLEAAHIPWLLSLLLHLQSQ